jgi:hypothetical protein
LGINFLSVEVTGCFSWSKKGGIKPWEHTSKQLEGKAFIPTDGGMSKKPTKESKMSDYPAIGLGYTVVSRGC